MNLSLFLHLSPSLAVNVCVFVCVCACVRACVRVRVCLVVYASWCMCAYTDYLQLRNKLTAVFVQLCPMHIDQIQTHKVSRKGTREIF